MYTLVSPLCGVMTASVPVISVQLCPCARNKALLVFKPPHEYVRSLNPESPYVPNALPSYSVVSPDW